MDRISFRRVRVCAALSLAMLAGAFEAGAQIVDGGSDAAIGKADSRVVLDLIARHLKDFSSIIGSRDV